MKSDVNRLPSTLIRMPTVCGRLNMSERGILSKLTKAGGASLNTTVSGAVDVHNVASSSQPRYSTGTVLYHPSGVATISVKPPIPTTLLLPPSANTSSPAAQAPGRVGSPMIASKGMQVLMTATPTPYVTTLITGAGTITTPISSLQGTLVSTLAPLTVSQTSVTPVINSVFSLSPVNSPSGTPRSLTPPSSSSSSAKQPILSKKASALVDNQLTSIIRSKASAMGLLRGADSPGAPASPLSETHLPSTPTSTSVSPRNPRPENTADQPEAGAENRDGNSPDIICLD